MKKKTVKNLVAELKIAQQEIAVLKLDLRDSREFSSKLEKQIDELQSRLRGQNQLIQDSVRKDFCIKAIAAAAGHIEKLPF